MKKFIRVIFVLLACIFFNLAHVQAMANSNDLSNGQEVQILGIPSVDSTLTFAGGWDPNASLTFQWLRDGVAIPNENNSSYLTTNLDWSRELSLTVTANASGSNTVSKTSARSTISTLANFRPTPTPIISGELRVFERLTASSDGWDAGANLSFRWFCGGVKQLPGGPNFAVPEFCLGKTIKVVVFGSKNHYLDRVIESGETLPVTAAAPSSSSCNATMLPSTETIYFNRERSRIVGGVSKQWMRDGVPIPFANDDTYLWTKFDLGRTLWLQCTISKTGFPTFITSSGKYQVPGAKSLILSPPSQRGKWEVGGRLQVVLYEVEPGASLTYQWLRNGLNIPSAVNETYDVSSADSGKSISVAVTASLPGLSSVTMQSSGVQIAVGPQSPVNNGPDPAPVSSKLQVFVTGSFEVGSSLVVSSNSTGISKPLSYQWLRNGVEIIGAKDNTYVLGKSDIQSLISVSAKAFDDLGKLVSALSSSRLVEPPERSTVKPQIPKITGVIKVGQTLRVMMANWGGGLEYQYRWSRNGKPISGASKNFYKLTSLDKGKSVTVRVTGSNQIGYSKSTTSLAVKVP